MWPKLAELPALSRHLAVFTAVCVGCAVLIRWSNAHLDQARQNLAAREVALAEARQRVQRSDEEKQTILRSVAAYRALEGRGMVGAEQRIGWLDALRAANQETELFGVDYELGPQQTHPMAARLGAGNLRVDESIMRLRFGLLHEEDLLRFLRVLAAQQAGSFSPLECDIQRLISDVSRPANQPTLRAECSLAWITIRPPAPAERRP